MASNFRDHIASGSKDPKNPGQRSLGLLDSDEEEDKPDISWKINTDYAKKYDDWRAKEEMQKCEWMQNWLRTQSWVFVIATY